CPGDQGPVSRRCARLLCAGGGQGALCPPPHRRRARGLHLNGATGGLLFSRRWGPACAARFGARGRQSDALETTTSVAWPLTLLSPVLLGTGARLCRPRPAAARCKLP